MFETLRPPPADPIIALMGQFAADPRADKIDLGVGVYRDAQGQTPVMRAVMAAETQILHEQKTKSYLGLAGDPLFLDALRGLTLGDAVDTGRIAAVATPGGSGAIRQCLELVRAARPQAAVWISDPSWPNHAAIAHALGFRVRPYRYLDRATGQVDGAAMIADIEAAAPGDVIILHGCCHNPSGADPDADTWTALRETCARRGLVPFIDLAYLGFGDGLGPDAAPLRAMAAAVPELLLAVSGSKTFGLYRERVGMAAAVCADPAAARVTSAMLATLNRQNFAFPPDHGARVVQVVLDTPALRAGWQDELDTMRARITGNRAALAAALRRQTQGTRFDFLTAHRGMFSLMGLAPDQTETLRKVHGIYLVGDSRANLAGLDPAEAERVATAIATVLTGL